MSTDGTWSSGSEIARAGEKLARLVRNEDSVSVATTGDPSTKMADLVVRVYTRTDVDYLQDEVPLFADGSWSTNLIVRPGTKIARVVNTRTNRVLNSTEWTGSASYKGLQRSFWIPQDDPDYGYEGDQSRRAGYRMEQRSYVYDDALAVLAYITRGKYDRAYNILDQLQQLQNFDGSLGFSYDTFLGRLYEDYKRAGALSWVGYAAVRYEEATGDPSFSGFATRLGNYLLGLQVSTANGDSTNDPRYGSILGGRGRYDDDYVFQDTPIAWASTEHNIDAYFFLRDLGLLTGVQSYTDAAQLVKTSLLTNHWSATEGRFFQGISPEGPDTAHALDTASWGGLFLLAVGERAKAEQARLHLNRFKVSGARVQRSTAANTYNTEYESSGTFEGYKPYLEGDSYPGAPDVVWAEGTWGALLFLLRLDDDISHGLQSMIDLQDVDPRGGYVQVTQGARALPYEFHVWPSVAGTAWAAMVSQDAGFLWRPDGWKTSAAAPFETSRQYGGLNESVDTDEEAATLGAALATRADYSTLWHGLRFADKEYMLGGFDPHYATWSPRIDRRAPTPVEDIEASSVDATERTVEVYWTPGDDSDIEPGVAGSGTDGDAEYRWRRAGSDWVTWRTTDGAGFTLPSADAGDVVDLQIRGIDRAGRIALATTGTITVPSPEAEASFVFVVIPVVATVGLAAVSSYTIAQRTHRVEQPARATRIRRIPGPPPQSYRDWEAEQIRERRTLRNRLQGDGQLRRGEEAHHIVPVKDRRADYARWIMWRCGLDMNDVVNGVGISRRDHLATFTNEYMNWLDEVLRRWDPFRGIEPCGLDQATLRQASEDFRRIIERRRQPGRGIG